MGITPTPENAREIGEMVVPFARENFGVTLDFSVESLKIVDAIMDNLRRDHSFEDTQPLLFSFGCYVGEVFVRNADGRWCTTASLGMTEVATSPIVVRLRDRGCNPVGKVYKRFRDGPADSLEFFYRVSVRQPEKEREPEA